MDVFAALAEPTRRGMLALLRQGERSVGEVVDAFPELSQPAISRHLRILREAGLVDVRPSEQRRLYSLRADGLLEIETWLEDYRGFWRDRLDALEAHLDRRARAMQTKKKRSKR